jgi:hypothetical protein
MVAELGLEAGAGDGAADDACATDWAVIREAYEGGDETVTEIATRFGVTKSAIAWRVKTQLWRMRNKRIGASGAALLARLYRLLERQIFDMEKEQSPMSEKEAAALGRVANTLDRLMQIERGAAPAKTPKRSSKDLEFLRNKIAKRLDELDRRQP